jgi:membrane fusion protein (multidrug efflux system)
MAATVDGQTSLEAQVSRTVTAAGAAEMLAAVEAQPATAEGPSIGSKANGPSAVTLSPASTKSGEVTPPRRGRRRWILLGAALTVVAAGAYFVSPWIETSFNTISTDDAYVNGHVTFAAPRVSGQVSRVLVDDNMRVRRGDVLVELDKEPYQVQVRIKQAAVAAAQKDLAAARSQVRGLAAQARSNRFRLEHSMEEVRNQLALLESNVAQLKVEQANLDLAERDFARADFLVAKGSMSKQQFDQQAATLQVNRNRVISADQTVQQTRAGLGLPINHENPLDVPENLDQNFSTVREALGALYNSAAQLGFSPTTFDATPKQAIEEFMKQDPERNLDRIYQKLMAEAPNVEQSEARLLQARRDLEQAELNLRYCTIVSEIDGVVTRRNVNPGNNVQVGQALMAVRSLTEIWVDANFKETQLAELRIGQRVRCEVDMYGSRREYEGRITGFTMGTGQTLALLPPQNATGNFVKIVQRLPVRIEFPDYDPEKDPLFVGLSVVPYVYFKEKAEGPHAGEVLQPVRRLPHGISASEAAEIQEATDGARAVER